MWRIWGLFAVQAIVLWSIGWSDWGTPVTVFLLWGMGFAAYAFSAVKANFVSRKQVWVGGILLRAGLFPLTPMLSEDIYRYIWDGWVQWNGMNPFSHAPADSALALFRTEWSFLINNADVPTIYPAGAQLIFFILAWLGPTVAIFKTAWLIADLITAYIIHRLSRGSGSRALLLYLWSPLLLMEVAWSGHFDPIGIAPMMGAVWVSGVISHPVLAALRVGSLLGLSISVKFAPLAVIPVVFRRYGVLAVAGCLAIPILLYIPFSSVGAALFDGLRTYVDLWQFNAGGYLLLEQMVGHRDISKWLGTMAVVVVVGWAAVKKWPLARALFWSIGTALIVSPTVHPWYLLWVLPLACLSESRGWILMTGTVFLSYAGRDVYLASGVWPQPLWLTAIIHVPPLALLAYDGWRGSRPQGLTCGKKIPEGK